MTGETYRLPVYVGVKAVSLAVLLAACVGLHVTPGTATSAPNRPATSAADAGDERDVRSVAPGEDQASVVHPCAPDSAERVEALASLKSLDATIMALAPATDPTPAVRVLRGLLDGPCFLIAQDDVPSLNPDSGLALKTFWIDGGKWWLEHYLDLGGARTDNGPLSVVAPNVRKTLTSDTHPDHPLRWLLCSSADERCAPETRGWELRAEHALRQHAESTRRDAEFVADGVDSCAHRPEAESERYEAWRACIENVPLRTDAFPVGKMKAPRDGWLVLRGRRGHYSFCDEERAYDLATGSAYVSKSCGRLALRADGSVDGEATRAAQRSTIETGMLPLGNLREAAWMVVLSREVDRHIRTGAVGTALPADVLPCEVSGREGRSHDGGTSRSNTGQTMLQWEYVQGGKSVVSGTLRWPGSYDSGAEDHAADLLRVAEAVMQPGRARVPLPPGLIGMTAAR